MRCFVAAAPPPPVREQLQYALDRLIAAGTDGRRVPADNFHLTWAFIGRLDAERAAALAIACSARPRSTADWQLDRLIFFRRAAVVAAGGPDSDALNAMAADVRALLDGLGIAYDRKPFRPHVTLLRKAQKLLQPREPFAIQWRVNDVALFESVSVREGVRYRRIEPDAAPT